MAKITINHEGNEMELEGTPEEIKEMLTSMGVKPAEVEEVEGNEEANEEATKGFQVGDYVRVTKDVNEHREGDVLEITSRDKRPLEYGVRNTRISPKASAGTTGWIDKEDFEPIEFIEGAPKVGDKILVVNKRGTLGEYKNGDVLTVVKVENHYYEEYFVYVREDSTSIGLFRNEFEIIERVAEPSLESLVGKYVKFMENSLDITAGKTYEIIEIDDDGDIMFNDDAGDLRSYSYPDFEEQYVIVDEPIEVLPRGTKVRLKKFGDIYTLGERRPGLDDAGYGTAYDIEEEYGWLGSEQFDVVKAEAVTRKVRKGDTIKITKDSTGTEKHRVGWAESGQGLMNVGSVGKVTEVTLKGIYAKFDGDQLGAGLVDKSRFYLAHGEYEVISAPSFEATPSFEVGDLAVIAEDADAGRLEIGDVVEIIGTAEYYDFNTERLTDGETEQFDKEELTKYVPEEKELSAGDKVVLAIPKGKEPRYGFGGVKTGDIGEVLGGGTGLRVKFENHSDWSGLTSEVLLVERAETKAEEAEEGGEEPKTFGKGDIVKIVGRTRFGDVSTGATARVVSGELDYDGELEVEYLDRSDYDYAKPEALEKISVEAAKPADFAEDGDIIRITEDRNGAEVGEIVEVSSVSEDGQVTYHYPRKGIRFTGRRGSYEIVAKHSDRKDV